MLTNQTYLLRLQSFVNYRPVSHNSVVISGALYSLVPPHNIVDSLELDLNYFVDFIWQIFVLKKNVVSIRRFSLYDLTNQDSNYLDKTISWPSTLVSRLLTLGLSRISQRVLEESKVTDRGLRNVSMNNWIFLHCRHRGPANLFNQCFKLNW